MAATLGKVLEAASGVFPGEARRLYIYDHDSRYRVDEKLPPGPLYVAEFPCPVHLPALFRVLSSGRWVLVLARVYPDGGIEQLYKHDFEG